MVSLNLGRLLLLGAGIAAALAAAALVAVLVLQPWDRQTPPLRFQHTAVASNGVECADIGKSILEKNGSAADAAIATLFCEGISCAQCMGLGGGFLLTTYQRATGRVEVLNARETAPAATTQDMFNDTSSTVGGLAAAVPGELRGYGELYRRYGRLPWAELVQPTADLCRRGHIVNTYMARSLINYRERILNEPSLREVYINPETGDVYKLGDVIKLPLFAETLDIIAAEGPEAMHNGSLTQRFVDDVRAFGGILTVQDMNDYTPEWQSPIEVALNSNLTLYTTPLPGSGSVLAFILNMLKGFVSGRSAPINSNLYWHRVVETFKFAYAKRTGLGDPNQPPDNLTVNIKELEANLSNPDWAAAFRRLVDDTQTFNDWQHYGALYEVQRDFGTAHIVVIAPNGDMVSATSTVNYIFGALRRSRSTGIILNNEMDDFAIPGRDNAYGMPPSPANLLGPGLRPLSSMVPSLVLDSNGRGVMAIGAAGGTKITTQVAMAVRGNLIEGAEFSDVMQRPRLHHQLMPMEVQHEYDFDQFAVKALRDRGHATDQLSPTAGFAAMVGAALDAEGYIVPQTDKRRPGSVAGF